MQTSQMNRALPGWLVTILRVVIVAVMPLALILINARILMTPAYLNWEYNRPDFPPDDFGFSTQDRLMYAPLALDYLFNNQGIEFLGEQKQTDGTPVYNERELSHMSDVKRVTQMLTRVGMVLVAIYVVAIGLLVASSGTRPVLARSLIWGGIITIALILLGMFLTLTAFDWLFTEFHRLFFTGSSWLFPTSDTLIRLFPEQFWVDAFALMFGGALLEAALIAGAMVWWLRQKNRARQ